MEGEDVSNHVKPGFRKGANTIASKDFLKPFVTGRWLCL